MEINYIKEFEEGLVHSISVLSKSNPTKDRIFVEHICIKNSIDYVIQKGDDYVNTFIFTAIFYDKLDILQLFNDNTNYEFNEIHKQFAIDYKKDRFLEFLKSNVEWNMFKQHLDEESDKLRVHFSKKILL